MAWEKRFGLIRGSLELKLYETSPFPAPAREKISNRQARYVEVFEMGTRDQATISQEAAPKA